MGCTVAMALLGICGFTFAGEPVSPHAVATQDRPAQEWMDLRANRRLPVEQVRVVERRRGVITVRPRG